MIVFGSRLFGKVDHVPGHFYVATRFAHLYFLPLFPTSSWVVLDDGSHESSLTSSQWQGARLGRIAWRSVAMAWLRAGLMAVSLLAAIFGLGALDDPSLAVSGIALAVMSVAAFAGSYRLGRADAARAQALARELGFPEEMEAQVRRVAQTGTGASA
ncbi:MAG: hypothetical protein QM767_11865 [Anaeromyxobacter sp.]